MLTWRLGSSSRKMNGLWNCLCKAAWTVILISLYLSCVIRGLVRRDWPLPWRDSLAPTHLFQPGPGALLTAFKDLNHRFPSRWKLISWLGFSLTLQLMETTSELL